MQNLLNVENKEMTGSASDSKFEVGAVLLDAIHEFSSNDCTEGEGEGIGGDNSICKLPSNAEILTCISPWQFLYVR